MVAPRGGRVVAPRGGRVVAPRGGPAAGVVGPRGCRAAQHRQPADVLVSVARVDELVVVVFVVFVMIIVTAFVIMMMLSVVLTRPSTRAAVERLPLRLHRHDGPGRRRLRGRLGCCRGLGRRLGHRLGRRLGHRLGRRLGRRRRRSMVRHRFHHRAVRGAPVPGREVSRGLAGRRRHAQHRVAVDEELTCAHDVRGVDAVRRDALGRDDVASAHAAGAVDGRRVHRARVDGRRVHRARVHGRRTHVARRDLLVELVRVVAQVALDAVDRMVCVVDARPELDAGLL